MPVAAGPPGPPTGWSREARGPRRPVQRCAAEGERRWTRRARTSDRQVNGYIYSLNRLDRDCRVYCEGYVAAHSVASPGSAAQRSIGLPRLQYAGGVGADFDWQAPRAPTDLGRHGPLHDDRDGPAGEPPEDVSSGEPEGTTYAEMEAVKIGVTQALAPVASGYLLDPEFGVGPAINRFVLPGR